MFWLDRDRGQPQSDGSASQDAQASGQGVKNAGGQRGPAPHVVISGRQLREEILSYGPAFLEPHRFSEPDAFRALVTVLAAYALGSRTAAKLVRERQIADPQWQPPSRREAMQVVSSLNRLRQYLPYLLGQRIQAAAGSGSAPQPQPQPHGHPSSAPPPRNYPPSQTPARSYPSPGVPARSYPTPPPQPNYPPPEQQPVYEPTPPPVAVPNRRATDAGHHTPRPAARVAAPPVKVSQPGINARPQSARASEVVVRPVISLNRRR